MSKGTVLVVDDDAGIREFMRLVLKSEGYRVTQASDGAAALALLAIMTPCVILLDMKMPGMDGWAFAREYHHRTGHGAPLVCMSAATDAAQRAQAIGAEDCLSKPFDLEDLLAVVDRYAHAL